MNRSVIYSTIQTHSVTPLIQSIQFNLFIYFLFIYIFFHSLIHSFFHPSSHSYLHIYYLFTYSFTHSFTHSFIHLSINPAIRTYIFHCFEKCKFAEDDTGLSVALQFCVCLHTSQMKLKLRTAGVISASSRRN